MCADAINAGNGGNADIAWGTIADTNTATFYDAAATPRRLAGTVTERHLETSVVLYCDGHVKSIKLAALNSRNANGVISAFSIEDD